MSDSGVLPRGTRVAVGDGSFGTILRATRRECDQGNRIHVFRTDDGEEGRVCLCCLISLGPKDDVKMRTHCTEVGWA